MVKKKRTGGRLKVSHKKKSGSVIKSREDRNDPDLVEEPADNQTPAAPLEPQTTAESHRGFPDSVYLLASIIFQNQHLEKAAAHRLVDYGNQRGLSLPEVKDKTVRCAAYELAFSAMKYQELLEGIMIDSCFSLSPPMPADQMGLAAVMLYDFQDRQFLPREPQGEEIIQEVRHVEEYLLRFKTKLAASLARFRVRHDLPSIQHILPESVRKKEERSCRLPVYAWVNTLRSSLHEVQGALRSAGFLQVESIGRLRGRTFCRDPHCGDTLVFPAGLKSRLSATRLPGERKLIIQDKSCILGPNAACSLLPEDGDLLMVGSFSGLTVAHTASLMAERHKDHNRQTVYVCVGDLTGAQRAELQLAVCAVGCKNVTLIEEPFSSLDSAAKCLQEVHVILLIPKCSVSAVSKPVEYILQENGDAGLLQDLSQGSIAQSKLEALAAQQRKDIDHALKFTGVLAVVYLTCSTYPEENVDVVSEALQRSRACNQEGNSKNLRVSPPPLRPPDHSETPLGTEPFFILEPSDHHDGCFLAVIKRQPEPEVKPAPEEVIARANAKGILCGLGSDLLREKDQGGQMSRKKRVAQGSVSQPNLALNIQPKRPQSKARGRQILCGPQEATSKQLLQVNPKPPIRSKRGVSNSLFILKQGSTSSSSFSSIQSESSTATESATSFLDSKPANNYPTPLPPAPPLPLATPMAPPIRPHRTPQGVLRPVVLAFPPRNFPDSFSLNKSFPGFLSGFSPTQRVRPAQDASHPNPPGGLSEEAAGKSRPRFCIHKL